MFDAFALQRVVEVLKDELAETRADYAFVEEHGSDTFGPEWYEGRVDGLTFALQTVLDASESIFGD